MSSRIRQNGYKKNLIPAAKCAEWAEVFSQRIKPAIQAYESGAISPAEFTARYVIEGLKILRPADWKGGPHHQFPAEESLCPSVDIFARHSLRAIPVSVNRSLYYWQTGKYPLRLYQDVPSADEVLKMQTQNYRCVSCITDPEQMKGYILGERDALSFTLHDLIHADHFFKHPEWQKAQVGFSHWMKDLSENETFKNWLTDDSEFAREFYYAASDMNSHPAHLVKYFKAVLTAALLRKNRQNLSDKLSPLQQKRLAEILDECAELTKFSSEFKSTLLALNSHQETTSHLAGLTRELGQLQELRAPLPN